MEPVTLIGSYLSPYVRKALVVLEVKGIRYRIDPIVPFFGGDAFSRLSPLRRIPVLIDDAVTLCDSTVICEYLDECHRQPAMYPRSPADRARARWLEEFADSRMGEVFIWHYFNQLVIRRAVWGQAPDQEVVRRATEEEIPAILDYLEAELPPDGYLFDPTSLHVADAAIGAMFRNAAFAGFQVPAERWPGTAAYVERVVAAPAFAALRPFEDLLLRTRIENAREALAASGAPLTDTTLAVATPRPGIMEI